MKLYLSKIESLLQTLVEGSVFNLFAPKNPVIDLGDQLVLAFKSSTRIKTEENNIAPDLYTIIAHPSYLYKLQTQKDWQDIVLERLISEAKKHHCSFIGPLKIQCEADSTLSPQKIEIVAQISIDKITSTTDMDIDFLENERCIPQNAFFIVNGNQTFPLTRSVVNIGRRPDNDLVIDDPRISRLHAQLRVVKEQYKIFDLDSTGGTSVNGQKIHQCVLSPGDVVSLAGVPLVYGQEPNNLGTTDQMISGSPAIS